MFGCRALAAVLCWCDCYRCRSCLQPPPKQLYSPSPTAARAAAMAALWAPLGSAPSCAPDRCGPSPTALSPHPAADFSLVASRQSLLAGDVTTREKSAATSKRRRDSLHTLEHCEQRGTCKVCCHRVGGGGHNSRSHWRCEGCNIFVCVPDCYNEHVKQLAEPIHE
jgi:hypothetical protein